MGYSGGSTELKDILLGSQRKLLNDIIGQVRSELGESADVYPGQVVPGVSPLQQQAFGYGGQIGDAYTRALSGQPAYEIDPAARERAYALTEAQTLGQFQKQLPYLEERYNAMGAGRSGGLQHAMAQAAGDVSLGLGAMRGQLEYQDEMARRQAEEMGAQRGYGAAMAGPQGLAGLGDVQRQIAGQQMGEGYNKWLMAQPYANPWLGFIPQALGTQAQTPVMQQWGFSLG